MKSFIAERSLRKIIHIDMDCFYAAIEIRDNPKLANKPVAVGGAPDKRGVICTCNYLARQYGVRAAMATAAAYRYCKELIVLPVDMLKYQQVAKKIQTILYGYSDLVEPLSLDEAYLDVTDSTQYYGSATLIAQAIRYQIWQNERLIASAGVAPNKFLAKIASGWKKPNGLFVISPKDMTSFIQNLPISELHGVGKVTTEKLHRLGIKTCADLQKWSLLQLTSAFGRLGQLLYEQCHGEDKRPVQPNKARKSLSVERTFPQDINHSAMCLEAIQELYDKLLLRIESSALQYRLIKSQSLKIKFHDFDLITREMMSQTLNLSCYIDLFYKSYNKKQGPIRLLGLGVHFHEQATESSFFQLSLL